MTDTPSTVGVVGLGQMGLAVALRLLAADFTVVGNRRREPPPAFLHAGGHASTTPAELADSCPVVVTVLPSEEALDSVVTGEHGLGATKRRGGVWVEMSTLPETVKKAAAERLADRGWAMLDCPISGAPEQLRNGEAVLFSSGDHEAHERVEPALRAISPHVRYLGAFGRGMCAKYTAHLLLAGNSLVAAEALAFAQAASLQIVDVLAMLSGTIVSSGVFDERGPRVLESHSGENPGVGVGGLAHDLAELHQFAVGIGASTPVLSLALDRLREPQSIPTDDPLVAFFEQLGHSSTTTATQIEDNHDTNIQPGG